MKASILILVLSFSFGGCKALDWWLDADEVLIVQAVETDHAR